MYILQSEEGDCKKVKKNLDIIYGCPLPDKFCRTDEFQLPLYLVQLISFVSFYVQADHLRLCNVLNVALLQEALFGHCKQSIMFLFKGLPTHPAIFVCKHNCCAAWHQVQFSIGRDEG